MIAAFAQRLTDRLDAERSGYSADLAGFDFIHV